jgi:PilX N-terminal
VKTNREEGMALITAMLVLVLISAIIVGFSWAVMTDQTMGGATNQRQRAFYAAEAGMEQLTANLNNLFDQNYAPTGAQVDALAGAANVPNIPGTSFVDPTIGTAGSGFAINFAKDKNGNPLAVNDTITAGTYQGMQGLVTPYTLSVIAQGATGGEVKLQRVVQTVGIPLFQFGIFSQTDLSFFAGPDFNFGGRVHTNGNLYLAEGGTLTLGDKVTAVGEVIRTNLANGWPTSSGYTGTVDVLTSPGNYRAFTTSDGSLVGTLGSAENSSWQSLSISTYNGYIRNGDQYPPTYTGTNGTGVKALNLEVATPLIGGTPIDLIRRPQKGEDNATTGNPGKLGERYFSQASLRILISDNSNDISQLPCETASAPIDLSLLAQNGAQKQTGLWASGALGNTTLQAIETQANSETGGAGSSLMPLAASGAAGSTYGSDGYWVPNGTPIIKGFIKIEAQTAYGVPCGTYKDVTAEILGLGYVGRVMSPYTSGWVNPPGLPALPSSEIAASTCADPNPNAVIRFERIRDNPSTGKTDPCVTSSTNIKNLTDTDVWPNALFDAREGNGRDWCPNGGGGTCKVSPTLAGVMYYVELDVNNLQRWFTGAIGSSGQSTKDANISSNDFSVYFSDRRGNYVGAALASGWPPASPTGNETGEYGFNDVVNPSSQYGCPDNTLDASEEFDAPQDTTLQTYGATAGIAPYPATPGGAYTVSELYTLMTGTFNSLNSTATSALQKNWQCANPSYITTGVKIWPGWYVKNPQEARENPPLFFRRALKLVNGSTINLGTCPNGNNCGLAIASENPVYIQGNFNAPGGSFTSPYGATSIIADAVTLLSNSWNDVNSFSSTYDTAWRQASNTSFRVAIAAGKGISFTRPTAYTDYQDFGTDGGVHNFLRFLEGWPATLNYKGSIVSLFYNRQSVGIFKDGSNNTVYTPPTRAYNFDSDFLTPSLLPPRTPMFRDTNTIGFTEYMLPN